MKKQSVMKLLAVMVSVQLAMSGCASADPGSTESSAVSSSAADSTAGDAGEEDADTAGDADTAAGDTDTAATEEGLLVKLEDLDLEDQFSDRDQDASYDKATATGITLDGDTASVSGDGVTVDGSTVTITAAGTYVVTGELDSGQIVVDAGDDDKVQIVLAGASITAGENAAILVKNADKVFLTLADGTTNTLSDSGEAYVQPEDLEQTVDGVIFALCDLTLNGSGMLEVAAKTGHGIVCKDDLAITDGSYHITAAGKGLAANDSIRILDGTFDVDAEDDAIHTSKDDTAGKGYIFIQGGTFRLASGDDGIHAATALIIQGGDINITKSYEGLEGDSVDILDGTITIAASDDGINASSNASAQNAENGGDGAQGDGGLPSGTRPQGKDGIHQGWKTADGENQTGAEQADTEDAGAEGASTDDTGTEDARAEGTKAEEAGQAPAAPSGGARGMGRGMNADPYAYIRISGGTIVVDVDGDGLDSNGSLYIDGGDVTVYGPTDDGNGALDFGDGGDAVAEITGGTVQASGSSGMAVTFADTSTQYSVMYVFEESQAAGTTVTLSDSKGNAIAEMTPEKAFQSVIFSNADLKEGTYTITAGDTEDTITVDSISVTAGTQAGAAKGGGGRPIA